VSPRLTLAAPPDAGDREPWPLRFRDFDVLGHVNNAAYWELVEELLARRRSRRAPLRVELEHVRAIERGASCALVHRPDADGWSAWLVGADGAVHMAAVLRVTP
jgi:acyl-ACP thioesterase